MSYTTQTFETYKWFFFKLSWYISFVNRHLGPFEGTPEAGSSEHWEFREQEFSELFIRLSAPLRGQLRSVGGVKQFTSDFGTRTLEIIRAVLVLIESDNKSLTETQETEARDIGLWGGFFRL